MQGNTSTQPTKSQERAEEIMQHFQQQVISYDDVIKQYLAIVLYPRRRMQCCIGKERNMHNGLNAAKVFNNIYHCLYTVHNK